MRGEDREVTQIDNFTLTFYWDVNKRHHDRNWEVWINTKDDVILEKVFTSTSHDISIGVYWFLKRQSSKVLEEIVRWKQFNDFQSKVE